jgi:hypothetical protein
MRARREVLFRLSAMANQALLNPTGLSSGFSGLAPSPPINVDALDPKELRALCKGMFQDLSFLAGVVPANVGSMISSSITAGAALTAGAIDGYLAEKSNIGPVGLSTAIAAGMAGYAMMTKDPDRREAAAAVARGFGAPILYELSKRKFESYRSAADAKADAKKATNIQAKTT